MCRRQREEFDDGSRPALAPGVGRQDTAVYGDVEATEQVNL